jgi:hypothetical protein
MRWHRTSCVAVVGVIDVGAAVVDAEDLDGPRAIELERVDLFVADRARGVVTEIADVTPTGPIAVDSPITGLSGPTTSWSGAGAVTGRALVVATSISGALHVATWAP